MVKVEVQEFSDVANLSCLFSFNSTDIEILRLRDGMVADVKQLADFLESLHLDHGHFFLVINNALNIFEWVNSKFFDEYLAFSSQNRFQLLTVNGFVTE